jgi:hypothetical protein
MSTINCKITRRQPIVFEPTELEINIGPSVWVDILDGNGNQIIGDNGKNVQEERIFVRTVLRQYIAKGKVERTKEDTYPMSFKEALFANAQIDLASLTPIPDSDALQGILDLQGIDLSLPITIW